MQKVPWRPPTSQRRSMRNSKNTLMRWLAEAEARLAAALLAGDFLLLQRDAALACHMNCKDCDINQIAGKQEDRIAALEKALADASRAAGRDEAERQKLEADNARLRVVLGFQEARQ
jgi:hypothetical protein